MVHKEVEGAVLQLPIQIVSPADVSRLLRELDDLDDNLAQTAIRAPHATGHAPRSSKLLEELITINKFDVLKAADRQTAQQFLKLLQTQAPVFHISFASDPSAAFMTKLLTWLRVNVHPQVLVRIGLEPTIAAGCILRTPNHQFDFSLRQNFIDKRDILRGLLNHPFKEVASER